MNSQKITPPQKKRKHGKNSGKNPAHPDQPPSIRTLRRFARFAASLRGLLEETSSFSRRCGACPARARHGWKSNPTQLKWVGIGDWLSMRAVINNPKEKAPRTLFSRFPFCGFGTQINYPHHQRGKACKQCHGFRTAYEPHLQLQLSIYQNIAVPCGSNNKYIRLVAHDLSIESQLLAGQKLYDTVQISMVAPELVHSGAHINPAI